MCRISGLVCYKYPLNRDVVGNINDVTGHRGPNGNGTKLFNYCCIGHVRLSIIDIEGSNQPPSNEDESIWVIFNGENYN